MLINLSGAELHNIVVRKGGLEVRSGYQAVHTPSSGTSFVGGFSIESSFTTEVWHYLFEQDAGGVTTMRVYTEDFIEMFSHPLGVLVANPVITHAVYANQIIVNSPAFSQPLYGLVGGGMVQALKTDSTNRDTTTLEIPPGHICSFGDRMPIAQGNIVYFNDPRIDLDPRTYVAQNATPLSGTIYDIFQADDGALYMFTSAGVFYMAQDALGKGQIVSGFIGMIPGLQTSRPRNAAASNGVVAVLQKDGIVILGRGQKAIDVAPYKGPRYYSRDIEVEDYRQAGEIHATSEGFIVAFGGRRDFLLDFNMRDGYRSYIWSESMSFNLIGTLRSRENDTMLLLKDAVLVRQGNLDGKTVNDPQYEVQGVASIEVDTPEGAEVMLRRVTTSTDNAGSAVAVYAAHQAKAATTPTRGTDVVVGTTSWDASRTYAGPRVRSVRHSMRERVTSMPIETMLIGSGSRLESNINVEVTGQGRRRGDKR